ncbi:hypothetical protein M8C21_007342 [Ambrosia artemisiifolia]|uniref:Uncharacterized protein n=1 Tax=Ambrosia artemisiifolia TaxID=4212 RepID=A0AAD5CCJ5_AMBAR|nr:hypothetical protein M8C21_007342 [Ambrosia artemisiifolia]
METLIEMLLVLLWPFYVVLCSMFLFVCALRVLIPEACEFMIISLNMFS